MLTPTVKTNNSIRAIVRAVLLRGTPHDDVIASPPLRRTRNLNAAAICAGISFMLVEMRRSSPPGQILTATTPHAASLEAFDILFVALDSHDPPTRLRPGREIRE